MHLSVFCFHICLVFFQVAENRVYYVQEIRGAVINRESVQKTSAVQCGGIYCLVERLVSVNGIAVLTQFPIVNTRLFGWQQVRR